MRIVIVGDGKVGYTLAEQLSQESHDVVIIDKDAEALRRADEALDVLCVQGSGASVRVLQEAGVEHANLLIAATTSDEMNMVCCLLGRKLGAQHTIARIRDPEYAGEMRMLKEELGLTMVINPEEASAHEIARLLRFPHATGIDVFAQGRVEIVSFRVLATDAITEQPLSAFARKLPADVLFCAVERDGQVIIPNGSTVLHAEDSVYIVGQPTATSEFFKFLGRAHNKVRDVMLVGGSRIARYLARELLNMGMAVKLIELDEEVAQAISLELEDALVICGDGTDQSLLQAEGLDDTDAFVALTDRDEENLLMSLYAHQQGLRKVVAKVTRLHYTQLFRQLGVDSVINPKLLAADIIVRYVRALVNSEGSAIETLYRIVEGKAEAIEFEARANSRLVGHPLRLLPLRAGVLLAALVRAGKIIIPRGDTVILPKDHVIAVTHGHTVIDLDDLLEAEG